MEEIECKKSLFFKMKNNQSQSEIHYKIRVKEREKTFFEKINISTGKSLKERKGAQYK